MIDWIYCVVWKSDDDLTIEVQVVRIYLLLELGDDSHPCASPRISRAVNNNQEAMMFKATNEAMSPASNCQWRNYKELRHGLC